MLKTGNKILKPICVLATLGCTPVQGAELTYRFTLPSFGGSGLNTNYFLNLLEQQKPDFNPTREKTDVELFEEQLRRRLLSAVASNIVSDIYATDANAQAQDGEVSVGDLNIVYESHTDTNQFCVAITDIALGSSSNICVPLQ